MTYKEARAFIDDTSKYGYILGLDTVTELLGRLGNPQDDLKFVHIAGTNGKGSILAYVSTILKEAGYKVGRYISPTIFEYRERIQVNEVYIPEEAVARLAERIYHAGQEMLSVFCRTEVRSGSAGNRYGWPDGCDKRGKNHPGIRICVYQYGSYGIFGKYSGGDRKNQIGNHQARYHSGKHVPKASGAQGS